MEISTKGKDIIKLFEGLYLRAYTCPGGRVTIGWGTIMYPNGKRVKLGDICTVKEAEEYLTHDCKSKEAAVERLVKVPLNQEMFDALVSWVYNLGEGSLLASTLLVKLNAGDYRGAADQFPRWTKSNGVVLPGLVKRRAKERDLFLEGIDKLEAAPTPSKKKSKG